MGKASMRPFSLRHRKALYDRQLRVWMGARLRRRIWMLLEKHNIYVSVDSTMNNPYGDQSTMLDETAAELKRSYGDDPLQVHARPGAEEWDAAVTLKEFVEKCYASQVLDVVEVAAGYLTEDDATAFARSINDACVDENYPWRFELVTGHFFQIDTNFLKVEMEEESTRLLKTEGFDGALDEFKKARNELMAGEVDDAIHTACKSFESTLMSITGKNKGALTNLVQEFVKAGHCDDLPAHVREPFKKNVLPMLGIMRDKLGAHGQGEDVLEVPRPYGQLAIHLAAAFNYFAMQKHIEQRPKPPEPEPAALHEELPPF